MTCKFDTPGQLISHLLDQRGWTKRTLAIVLEKDESTVGKMVSGKGTVTPETAIALEDIFGVAAEEFLSLQKAYDLAIARISTKPDKSRATRAALFGDLPISEMIKRGWIDADSTRNLDAVEAGLTRFFGVQNIDQIEILPHAAKKTAVNSVPTPAQLAWLYRVKSIAEETIVGPYSRLAIERALPKLHALTVAPEEARHAPRILAECGIRFVVVEQLPGAKIDGVCFWLDQESPVIGLSFRHDRIDNFWFVLRHEIEHVRLGHGQSAMILDADLEGDRAGTGPDVPDEERLANAAGQEFCVPAAKMKAFVDRKSPFFSERDLVGFAKVLRVHPGLVAGQLQNLTGRYDRFRDHLRNIRSHVVTGAPTDGWGDVYPLNQQ